MPAAPRRWRRERPLAVVYFFCASVDLTTGDVAPDGKGEATMPFQEILVNLGMQNDFFVDRHLGVFSAALQTALEGDIALVKLEDGSLIDAKPVNVSKAGERTQVSIRPERVEINPDLGPDAHTLKAEVLEFIYMGDVFRTRLRVAGKDDFIVKTRNRADQERLKPGTQVEIGWLPQDCRALDA